MELDNTTIGKIINHNGHDYILTSHAWWLSEAVKLNNGKIEIARISANSTTIRKRSLEELETLRKELGWRINPYEQSTEFNGDYIGYMLSLTEQDLINYNITPGKLNFPDIIPCKKPNQSIISEKQHDHNMHMLQTEGYGDGEDVIDNTPYMKGDNIND